MRETAKGTVIGEGDVVVGSDQLEDIATAVGTSSGPETARLVPFFGPTAVGGETTVVVGLELDLNRALLAGVSYEWRRPFREGESLHVRVRVEDVFTKGKNQFGTVNTEFLDTDGKLVQSQRATFIERGVA
ncbi:MaoC family dehydratase [Nitriliruptoraceae bacterium ZYF776]|nr:MaoC family dehydratase [Profundirhabdus halotolerans]